MDLGLDDEQAFVVESFSAFFRKEATPAVVRAGEPLGFDRALWDRLAATGALGIGVDGGDLLTAALVLELAGRAAAPVPLAEGITLGRLLEGEAAGGEHRDGFASGDRVGTVALRPAVDGVARGVPAGAVADAFAALDGDELVLVVAPAGPSSRPIANLAAAPIADRPCRGDVDRVVLATGSEAERRFDALRRDWRVLAAASLVGVGATAVDVTADYARQRHQFGRPIGSFQAIAHALVDAATDVDGARLLVQESAWAVDDGDERADALAVMALRFAAEAAQRATATGLHVHGGYGFMLEYDIQLLYRRARGWPLAVGTPGDELQRLADALWGPTTTAPAA